MLSAERLVNMSTRARRHTTHAHVLACLQVVFHSASCQRTTLLRCQRKSRSTLYLTFFLTTTITLSPTLLLHGYRRGQSEKGCALSAALVLHKNSMPRLSFSTIRTMRCPTSGARSAAFAAIYLESDSTSPAKDFERMRRGSSLSRSALGVGAVRAAVAARDVLAGPAVGAEALARKPDGGDEVVYRLER